MRRPPLPAIAIAIPATRRLRASAYQRPSPATASGISSFVVHASAAQIANGRRRSSSRNQNANNSNGHASATGWNSESASHCVAGKSRYAIAKPSPARSLSRCLRASQ